MVWTGDDEELRKTLTTIMRGQEGVIIFDNLTEGTVIRSAVLAKLLTDRTWGDRLLGGNVLASSPTTGCGAPPATTCGSAATWRTRSVLITLDPAMPHPERRSGFAIPDLESWIEEPASQQGLFWVLLVLAADWARPGARKPVWCRCASSAGGRRCAGGFLAHHGIGGFLANAGELENADDDVADWTQFLARWLAVLGPGCGHQRAAGGRVLQGRLGGMFPSGKDGQPLSVKSMGRRLTGIKGRYHGAFALKGQRDNCTPRCGRGRCRRGRTQHPLRGLRGLRGHHPRPAGTSY